MCVCSLSKLPRSSLTHASIRQAQRHAALRPHPSAPPVLHSPQLEHQPADQRHGDSAVQRVGDSDRRPVRGALALSLVPHFHPRADLADAQSPLPARSCISAAPGSATSPSRPPRSPFPPRRRTSSPSSTPRTPTSRSGRPSCARRQRRASASCARWARRTSARTRRPTSSRASSRSGPARRRRPTSVTLPVPRLLLRHRRTRTCSLSRCRPRRRSTRTRTSPKSSFASAGRRQLRQHLSTSSHKCVGASLLARLA